MPVRDQPGRIEVVYAVAFDTDGGPRSGCWRMGREPDGRIAALVTEALPAGDDVLAGRFAYLLTARS